MTKRVFTLILAVMFVLSAALLTACAGGTTTPTTDAPKTEAPKTNETTAAPTTEAASTPAQTTEAASTPAVDTPTAEPSTEPVDVSTTTPVEQSTTTPEDDVPECPPEGTAAWAAWLVDYGTDSPEYGDKEAFIGSFYTTSATLENGEKGDATPWENWGTPKHFQFLYTMDSTEFDFSFNSNTEISPYTWHIWFKDKDTDDEYAECITKPWSLYDWGDGSYICRIPTYGGGMTTLHSDDGEPNAYQFVIAVYVDETDELLFWHTCSPSVTNSYDFYQAEALDNDYKLGWDD